MAKKFYWLKLQKDFFKRHDIRIIRAMPNGETYINFYLMLLLESITHNGELRFNETIPYNEDMLSVITDTNIDIVRSAMKVFTELKMIEILDDQTIYMTETNKLIGCESESAERVRNYRNLSKTLQCNKNVQKCNTEIEIDKELDIEIEKDIDKKDKVRHKHGEYKHVLLTDEQYQKLISDFSETIISEYIKKVDEYCQQYKKHYGDYNLTIRKWINKDKPKNETVDKYANDESFV